MSYAGSCWCLWVCIIAQKIHKSLEKVVDGFEGGGGYAASTTRRRAMAGVRYKGFFGHLVDRIQREPLCERHSNWSSEGRKRPGPAVEAMSVHDELNNEEETWAAVLLNISSPEEFDVQARAWRTLPKISLQDGRRSS